MFPRMILIMMFCLSEFFTCCTISPPHCRGNHETGGTWKQGAIHEDIEDLLLVVEHLKKTYGYVVDLVVGHSRGSIVGFHWISQYPDGRSVSAFVNASGRYRMQVSRFLSKDA